MLFLSSIVAKQQKSLKARAGGAVDETQDDAEDEEDKSVGWGRSKNIYYDNNKVNITLNFMDLVLVKLLVKLI